MTNETAQSGWSGSKHDLRRVVGVAVSSTIETNRDGDSRTWSNVIAVCDDGAVFHLGWPDDRDIAGATWHVAPPVPGTFAALPSASDTEAA